MPLSLPHDTLPFFSVNDYGAVGDGVVDDRASVQATHDAVKALGGGTVYFPRGTYRMVSTSGGTGGSAACLYVDGDNITVMGDGAGSILAPELGAAPNSRTICVTGGGKIDRLQWYHHWYQDELGYTISAAARSAQTVTCTVAGSVAHGGFAAGDYVYIRTGQLIHETGGNMSIPSSELNVVQSVSGEVITLRYALAKPYDQEYYQGNFVTSVTSGVHGAGSTVITVASTTGWAVRDTIRIPAYGLNGNDYFSTVSALTGTTLTVEQAIPTGSSVPDATTIYNGRTSSGVTSSTVATAHLVPMLIAKVNHITVSNFTMHDIAFAQSTVNFMTMLHGVHNAVIEKIFGYYYKNGVCSGGNFRHVVMRDCALHATGAGVNFATAPFAPATGCSDVICTNNFFSSEGLTILAPAEGNTGIWIKDNFIHSAPNTVNNHAVSVRTRGWDIQVTGNTIVNGSTPGNGIFVDPTVTGGVMIDGNTVRGSMGAGIVTQAINVSMGWNDVQSGLGYRTSAGVGLAKPGAIFSISDWVTSVTAEQLVTIGEIPSDWYVHGVDIHVSVAFNSDGTDQIKVGYSGTTEAFATLTDVSTTGVKTVTLGTGIGRQTALRSVLAEYVNGGSEPTTGKAVVIVKYSLIPLSP